MNAEPHASIPTVLIVEDERDRADRYTEYLRDVYEVRTAYGGEEALEMLAADVNVVLLDRRMPVVSGTEVLATLEDRDVEARVALITDDDPEFDIIDLPADDYLVKPVTRQEVRDTVDRLLTVAEYNERMQELTSRKLTRNVLEVEKSQSELRESREFERLSEEIESLEAEVEGLAAELEAENLDHHV